MLKIEILAEKKARACKWKHTLRAQTKMNICVMSTLEDFNHVNNNNYQHIITILAIRYGDVSPKV
jgi:hypothetical protein